MKKTMYMIRGLLILLISIGTCFTVSGESASSTESLPGQPSPIHSMVVSFDAPVFKGLNQSENLFNAILKLMNDQQTDIGRRFDKLGAIWTASHNLSGVQLAFFYADDPEKVVDLALELFELLKNKAASHFSDTKCHDFSRYLHQICRLQRPQEQRISVQTGGGFHAFNEKIAQTASAMGTIYEKTGINELSSVPPVLPDVLPTVFNVFKWDHIDSSSFFSAKFTGEQFKKEATDKSPVRYDLLFGDDSVYLVAYISGSEEELFGCYNHFNNVRRSFLKHSSGSWQGFAAAAEALQKNDLRDVVKTTMLNAWLTHWGSKSSTYSSQISFVQAASAEEKISMPADWLHSLSYSKNLFPFFATSNSSDNSETADIAISITASSPVILKEIVGCLKNRQGISFPFSVELQNNQRVIISFFGQINEISGNIARLRARILNYLFEKGLITELPGPLKIGISGICNIPPFILRGLLQEGWPPTTAESNPRPATEEDIFALPELSAEGKEAGQRRITVLSSSSRGRAELLAVLTSEGIQLRSMSFTEQ